MQWRPDDQIHIWTKHPGPFQIRDSSVGALAGACFAGKVTPAEIGGGFGGKFTPYTDLPAALLSRRALIARSRCTDAHRGTAGDRPHIGQLHQSEDGSYQGRPHHCS